MNKSRKQSSNKPFWVCGGDSAYGCKQEVYGSVGVLVKIGRGKRVPMHRQCAEIAKEQMASDTK